MMADHPRLDVHVLYLDKMGVDGTIEPTTGNRLAWDLPLLEGYPHRFLNNWSPARFRAIVDRINPTLPAALLAGGFDAAMFHGWLPLSNWLGVGTALAGRIRLIYRGEGSVIGKEPPQDTPLQRLKLRLNRTFLRQMDAVAYSCADNRRYQLSRGARPHSLFAMPCAVDNAMLKEVSEGAEPRALRQRLGIADGEMVVLAAGRFTDRKRMADIVAALPENTHLMLAGAGPLEPDLRHQVQHAGLQKRVHFLGFVNQPQLLEAMLASDVFAMASSYDPSPKAMSEALAFGLPLVCSDGVGTCEDLVQDNGFRYPCGDVSALADRLSRLRADDALRMQMAERAKVLASKNDFSASVESLLQTLDRLQVA
jgi:glycosyltransferase involved in cell wall biosynthesis